MNWEAIGAVGELLGSLAVFVTLVYLAIQVRHARTETRLLLSQGRLQANREGLMAELDPANLDARLKAQHALGVSHPAVELLKQHTGLEDHDAWRVFHCEVLWWNYRIHVIANIDELPEAERVVFDSALRTRYVGSSTSAFFYQNSLRDKAHPDIVRYIDARIAEANAETAGGRA